MVMLYALRILARRPRRISWLAQPVAPFGSAIGGRRADPSTRSPIPLIADGFDRPDSDVAARRIHWRSLDSFIEPYGLTRL